MPTPADPIERAVAALSQASIEFVVVGMFGINLHARDASETFVTQDLDVLLRADLSTLKSALARLSGAGFTFETGGEPFVDLADDQALGNVLRSQATLRGVFEGEMIIDLMLSMAGMSEEEVASDAIVFQAFGFDVKVGSLEKLLESKRRSGRPKDLTFLAHYDAVMAEKKRP